ncbi:VOC family protein [Pseudomonas aeruginosa]|nr:VOC family protein [Pseudomonas aeruginosa]
MNFYLSLFDDAEILQIQRYGAEGPGPEGSVLKALFRLGDQSVHCIDSHVRHAFDFTPAFSFFVDCESNAQIERLAEALGDGGKALMPLGDYGFSQRFAWLADRFGVSWQLNLA